MPNAPFVQLVECPSAETFLDAISPRGPYLRRYATPRHPRDLIFRGHSDDRQRLVPSAFRGNLGRLSGWNVHTPEAQLRAEIEAITEFFWAADLNGLALPEDSQDLRQRIEALRTPRFVEEVLGGEATWPPNSILSLLALAQHYGLSTRLLDWSRSDVVAAYFAGLGAATALLRPHCPECGADPADDRCSTFDSALVADRPVTSNPVRERRLSVWAFSQRAYQRDNPAEPILGGDRPVKLVTAPSASIPNLRAQQGLFSVYRPTDGHDTTYLVDSRPLDEILREPDGSPLSTLFHFTLPVAQSGRLLWLLAQHGVSGASLFPGYDGVVKSLFERELWGAGSI